VKQKTRKGRGKGRGFPTLRLWYSEWVVERICEMRIKVITFWVIRFLDLSSFFYLESITRFRNCVCFLPQVKEWGGIYLFRLDYIETWCTIQKHLN
jgi:hypothetical protein